MTVYATSLSDSAATGDALAAGAVFIADQGSGLLGAPRLLQLPLTSTVVATVSAPGAPNPTSFARAQAAFSPDLDNVLRFSRSGEVRFLFGRRVENLVTKSEPSFTFGIGGTTPPTTNGNTTFAGEVVGSVTLPTGAAAFADSRANILESTHGIITGCVYRIRARMALSRALTGSEQITLSDTGIHGIGTLNFTAANGPTALTEVSTLTIAAAATGNNALYIFASGALTAPITVYFTKIQVENVTLQANQNPSDYVSRGVLAGPIYHGCMIDGVKWFDTLNNITVAGNVVNEPKATNLLVRSHALTTSPWSVAAATASLATSVIAPGGSTAFKLVEDSSNAVHIIRQTLANPGSPATVSIFAKAGERTNLYILSLGRTPTDSASTVNVWFDLVNKTISGTGKPNATMVEYPGGWFRCSLQAPVTASAEIELRFGLSSIPGDGTSGSSGNQTYQGDGVSGLYMIGGQLETGTVVTPLITTAAAAVTARIPGAALAVRPKYYKEPLRSNLLLQANSFTTAPWIVNAFATCVQDQVAPDGTLTAWTFTDIDAAQYGSVSQTITVPNDSSTYVVSIYVKKNPTGKRFGINVGLTGGTPVSINPRFFPDTGSPLTTSCLVTEQGDYWRVIASITNNSSGNTVMSVGFYPATQAQGSNAADSSAQTGSQVIWGAQVERVGGASEVYGVSSYIPTAAVAVTRPEDQLIYQVSGHLIEAEGSSYASTMWMGGATSTMGSNRIIGDGAGAAGTPLFVQGTPGTAIVAGIFDGATATLSGLGDPYSNRVQSRWFGSTEQAGINGVTGNNGATYDGAFLISSIGIGMGGGQPFNGGIGDINIFGSAYTIAQLDTIQEDYFLPSDSPVTSDSAGITTDIVVEVGRGSLPTVAARFNRGINLDSAQRGPSTFIRASVASVSDALGQMQLAVSGEARVHNVRRVRNLAFQTSENFGGAQWVKTNGAMITPSVSDPDGGTRAWTFTATASGLTQLYQQGGLGILATATVVTSIWLRRRAGTGTVNLLDPQANAIDITSQLTSSWRRFSVSGTAFAANAAYIGCSLTTAGDAVDVAFSQVEDATGRGNANPSEYASVGRLTAPYHGAGVDGARLFDYPNPMSLVGNVVVDGSQRINYLTQSSRFDQWGSNPAIIAVTPDAIAAPDGTVTADLITVIASGAALVTRTATVGGGGAYVASIYVKQGSGPSEANVFDFRNDSTATDMVVCSINYATGALSFFAGTGPAFATNAGGGWWRIPMAVSSGISAGNQLRIYVGFTGGVVAPGLALYAWGAQIEPGDLPSNPISTTTTPRSGFPESFDASLGVLIEPPRTNAILNSQDLTAWTVSAVFRSADQIVAPDGTLTADSIREDSTSNYHYVSRGSVLTAGVASVVSGWAKQGVGTRNIIIGGNNDAAGFDPVTGALLFTYGTVTNTKVVAYPNGWFRYIVYLPVSHTSANAHFMMISGTTAGSSNYVGDNTSLVYGWGFQAEQGLAETSYIPTGASAVARPLDVPSMPTVGNLASNDQVIYLEWTPIASTFDQAGGAFLWGTRVDFNNRTRIRTGANGVSLYAEKIIGGVASSSLVAMTFVAGQTYRIAARFSSTAGIDLFVDGVKGVNSANVQPLQIDSTMTVGSEGGSPGPGYYRNLLIVNANLTDAQMQALPSGLAGSESATTGDIESSIKITNAGLIDAVATASAQLSSAILPSLLVDVLVTVSTQTSQGILVAQRTDSAITSDSPQFVKLAAERRLAIEAESRLLLIGAEGRSLTPGE